MSTKGYDNHKVAVFYEVIDDSDDEASPVQPSKPVEPPVRIKSEEHDEMNGVKETQNPEPVSDVNPPAEVTSSISGTDSIPQPTASHNGGGDPQNMANGAESTTVPIPVVAMVASNKVFGMDRRDSVENRNASAGRSFSRKRSADIDSAVQSGRLVSRIPGGMAYDIKFGDGESPEAAEEAWPQSLAMIAIINRAIEPPSDMSRKLIREFYEESCDNLLIGSLDDDQKGNPFLRKLWEAEQKVFNTPLNRLLYLSISMLKYFVIDPFNVPTDLLKRVRIYVGMLSEVSGLPDPVVSRLHSGVVDPMPVLRRLSSPWRPFEYILRDAVLPPIDVSDLGWPEEEAPLTAVEALQRLEISFQPNEFGLEAMHAELREYFPDMKLVQFRELMTKCAAKVFMRTFQLEGIHFSGKNQCSDKYLPVKHFSKLQEDGKGWSQFYSLVCEFTFGFHAARAASPFYKNGYPGSSNFPMLVEFFLRKFNLQISDFEKPTEAIKIAYFCIINHIATALPPVVLQYLSNEIPSFEEHPQKLPDVLNRLSALSDDSNSLSESKLNSLGVVFNYPFTNSSIASQIAELAINFDDPDARMVNSYGLPTAFPPHNNYVNHFKRGQTNRIKGFELLSKRSRFSSEEPRAAKRAKPQQP
ncbi:hypothetical protein TRVA0_029S00474 [Trichomonascus vanleenenianus]|uniref:uncharacterized protein n=1 Tax=Trichomonascus vanleenenianus TaxID=2268995 RepID=UPI003ECB9BCC